MKFFGFSLWQSREKEIMGKRPANRKMVSSVYRPILKTLNSMIRSLSKLERDPPISKIAWMEVRGELRGPNEMRDELLSMASKVNRYRKDYWDTERRIKQDFLTDLRRSGYLPSSSKEVNSLKRALPEELIRGDGRLWIYSYDQYIGTIAGQVGRKAEDAPKGEEIWNQFEGSYFKRMKKLVERANQVLPEIYRMKAKIRLAIKNPEREWVDLRVKRPRFVVVKRPIRHVMLMRKPIPLERKVRPPRKRIFKRPKMETIGPEDVER